MSPTQKQKLFKIALAINSQTLRGFAKDNSVSAMAIVRVLQEKSKSKALTNKINFFIKDSIPSDFKKC